MAAGLAGCLDLGLVGDVVFPPGIPGLPSAEPWLALPVRAWVTEGRTEARCIAACLQPGCGGPAVVGLFTATGPDADRLAAAARDPARLAAMLMRHPSARTSSGRTGSGRTKSGGSAPGRQDVKAIVAVERVASGRLSGVLVHMSRPDGTRPVHGEALILPGRGGTTLVLAIGEDGERVRRLATDVGAALGSGPGALGQSAPD